MIFWSAKKQHKDTFLPPTSPFPGNFCNCISGGICFASQFEVQLSLLYTAWSNAYSEIGPEVTLLPLMTSCVKDYKGHSLVQTSFTEPPNRMPQNAFFPQTRDLLVIKKIMQTLFFHPLSPFPANFCNYNSGGICTGFNFHCKIVIHSVKQRLLRNRPGSDAAITWLLARKIKRSFTRANQLHWTGQYISNLLLSVQRRGTRLLH